MEEKKRGRPTVEDPRVPVTIYVPSSVIEKFGNKSKLKAELHQYIKSKAKYNTYEIYD